MTQSPVIILFIYSFSIFATNYKPTAENARTQREVYTVVIFEVSILLEYTINILHIAD